MMQRKERPHQFRLLIVAIATIVLHSSTTTADEDQMEANAQRAYDRYLKLLQRSPKEGVSLDRVYGYHVDRGSLEDFLKTLKETSEAPDANGSSAMLLGLIESRRGQDNAARSSFEIAEARRPDDPMVSWYLGQSLQAIGETRLAAEAMERSLTKNVPRTIQERVYLKLGRIYQRDQQTEQAIDLWKRFERAFPNDDRVQEQIAAILIDENQLQEALARYESLIKTADEPYRRVQFGVKAAQLKLKLGQQQEALSDYESLLEQLKPASWLFNDVRGRIEESFVRTDDYAGLVDYYEAWMKSHSDDLDAMTRLGKYLAVLGRSDEAKAWYRKAIAKAPTNSKLRLSLIEQLIGDSKYVDAIKEYEALAEIDRGNPDNIERWGMLYLRHPDLDTTQRRAKASAVWKQLLTGNEDDAVTVSRLADLFRSASMVEESISYYKRAIEIEPQNPQYSEYLGEYLHLQNRQKEAREVWKSMVAGEKRTTQNLVRLSEVYKNLGYADEALQALEEACSMDPEFGDRIRLSSMMRDAGRFDASLEQLSGVEKLVASPDEAQIVLQERIKTLTESGQLKSVTEKLERRLSKASTADEWRIVAMYQEASNRLAQASKSVATAVKLEPNSIPSLTLSARIYEKSGLLSAAADANRTLAKLDARFRSEYLKTTAELERRLGRIEQSLQAGKDLITAAPGNPESYRFYSDLCFQVGRTELGLDALRRSVRINPSDVDSLTQLAKALADQFETPEAIELYWRAFQKAEKLDQQIQLVQILTELYLRTNNFDRLIVRLENLSKDLGQQRDMVICLANAHQAAGDTAQARDVLKELLSENSRDAILLDELSVIAEDANDLDKAVEYQEQIVQLSPTVDSRTRLANLYMRKGDPKSAKVVWDQMATAGGSSSHILKSVDKLIVSNSLPAAAELCDQLLASNPDNWEALLRLSVIQWRQGQDEEVKQYCDKLLSLRIPRSTISVLNTSGQGSQTMVLAQRAARQSLPEVYSQTGAIQTILRTLGAANGPASAATSSAWSAKDFGHGRAIAIAMSVALERKQNSLPQYFADLKQRAKEAISDDPTAAWDLWHAGNTLAFIPAEQPDLLPSAILSNAVELLLQTPDPAARIAFLESTLNRAYYQANGKLLLKPPEAKPLSAERLQSAIQAWETVAQEKPNWLVSFGGVSRIVNECERAGATDLLNQLLAKLVGPDATQDDLNAVLKFAAAKGDFPQVIAVTKRLAAMPQATRAGSNSMLAQLGTTFANYASRIANAEDFELQKNLIDAFLDIKAETYNPSASPSTASPRTASPNITTSGRLSGGPTSSTAGISGRIVLSQGIPAPRAPATYPIYGGRSGISYQQTSVIPPNKYFSNADQAFFLNLTKLYPNQNPDLLRPILVDYNNQATGRQKVFGELAIASVDFLRGNKELSVIHQVRAAALAPDDTALRLNLVQYYMSKGNHTEALQLLDTINAIDQSVLKNREIQAILLAAKTGNTDRAKQAAERLFGLRLDSQTSIWLSKQMQDLDMKEMSTALLARTRKTAGNNLQTLVSLMGRYQLEGNMDVASQIAHQILRNTRGMSVSRTSGTSADSARKSAVSVLAKSGQLDGLLARVQRLLDRSPNSIELHRTLIEYYLAAGKTQEASQLNKRLKVLTPETVDSLFAAARKLDQKRQYGDACAKYLEAFQKDPRRFLGSYYTYCRAFQNAGRQAELLDLLIKDNNFAKSPDGYQIVTQAVQTAFQQGSRSSVVAQKKAVELFRAAWAEYPNYRSELIGRIQYASVWRNPEMVQYAMEGIIPTTIQQAIAKPWVGIADSVSYSSNSNATGTISTIIDSLNRTPDRRDEFAKDVERAVAKFDKWHGGKIILALLKAAAGKKDECFDLVTSVRDDPEVIYIPLATSWVVGYELERLQEDRFLQLAIDLLEDSMSKVNLPQQSASLSRAPGSRLARLYSRLGQTDNARLALRKAVESFDYSKYSSAAGYSDYVRAGVTLSAAEMMLEIDCPFDALEYFEQITPEAIANAGRFTSSLTRNLMLKKDGKKSAIKAINAQSVAAYLQRISLDEASTINLLISPPENNNDMQTQISSVLIDQLIKNTDAQDSQQISALLDKMLSSADRPLPAVAIIAVELAAATKNKQLLNTGYDMLQQYLNSTVSSKRIEDMELAFWLPARTALAREDHQEIGNQLSARATAAAESCSDETWLMAMMKERGDAAIAKGDRKLAEESWSRLLDVVLADKAPAIGNQPVLSVKPDGSPAGNAPPKESSPTIPRPIGSALEELRKQLLNPATNSIP